MQAVLPRLAGGSIPAELVAATAATSIFTLVCVLCGRLVYGRRNWQAPRPPAAACLGTWLVGHLKRVLRLSLHVLPKFGCLSCHISVMLCVRWVVVGFWWF